MRQREKLSQSIIADFKTLAEELTSRILIKREWDYKSILFFLSGISSILWINEETGSIPISDRKRSTSLIDDENLKNKDTKTIIVLKIKQLLTVDLTFQLIEVVRQLQFSIIGMEFLDS